MRESPTDFSAMPAAMQERRQWLVWRREGGEAGTKPRKVPYYVNARRRQGEQGSADDRENLATFGDALAALERMAADGLGFAFLPGDGLIGIDIDGAIDLETGEVSERCRSIIEACGSYTEFSPSGTGVHIIVQGECETFKNNRIGIEVFCGRQFFTCTGRTWPGAASEVRPVEEGTLRRLRVTVKGAARAADAPQASPRTADDAARRYCLAALDSAVGKVRAAGEGARNDTLNTEAFGLAQLLHTGGLSEAVLRAALTDAARAAGLADAEIQATLRSAVRAGLDSPRALPERRRPQVQTPAPSEAPSDGVQTPLVPDWPEPMLPGSVQTPEIQAEEVLPSWLGAMAAAVSTSTQTPSALATLLSLSVLGTVLQRRFEVEVLPGYREPGSIWTLVALPSGTRKTAVINALTAPLVHWEKLIRDRMRGEVARVTAARAVAKKRIERLLQDASKAKNDEEREAIRAEIQREEEGMPDEVRAPRLFTGDTTSERCQSLMVENGERIAVLSDEAGIFLIMAGVYSGGVASLDVFLQGHAGTAMRVDRAGRMAHLDRPALTFGLALQPGVLADVAGSRRFRDSGLLARFLFALPKSNVGRRDVRRHAPVPHEVASAYEVALMRLLEDVSVKAQAPRVLKLTAEARECWYQLAEEIEREQGDGGRYESFSDWTSKLPGAAARIALLLELAECGGDAPVVGLASMERAARLARLLIPHAQAAFGLLGTDAVDADAAAIVKWIQACELAEFKRSEAQKAMEGRFRSVDRLIKAMERLETCDVVRFFKRPNPGAPPSPMYRVNPKVHSR